MLLRNALLLLLGLFSGSCLYGQLEVKTEDLSATYRTGDTAWLLISSNQSGNATFEVRFDRFNAPIQTGSIDLIAGQTIRFPLVFSEAGVIHFQILQNGNAASVSLIFAPFQIQALIEEPVDFDDFWEVKRTELADIPIDPKLQQLSQSAYSTTYRINLASIANRRVYGYISIPNGTGPFPAILTLPSFGADPNIVQPEPTIAEQGGAISMTISIHNAEPDAIDPDAYTPDNIADPNEYYFRWAIQAGLRSIEYLFTRPDFDQQHLGVVGVSQGGALALMLAGIDKRVNLLAVSNPAYCQHAGLAKGVASGFPYLLNNSRSSVGTAAHEEATLNASAYYDAIFFARRYEGPALMVVGYRDDVCPAATSLAAYNQLKGTKVLVHAPELGHIHPAEYWNGRFDLFRQHFLPSRTPPWPWPSTTTGYLSFAGNDLRIDASSQANLRARTFLNNAEVNDWPIAWEKVSGPGIVNFNPVDAYSSSASFNAIGDYCLRFTAQDKSMLDNSRLFYSISDALQVEVDGNGQRDTRSPSLLLETPNATVNGVFIVNATFDEPVLGFSLSSITVENATLSDLSGLGANYQFTVSPLQEGLIKLQVLQAQVQDTAGNNNVASNVLNVFYEDIIIPDIEPPKVVLRSNDINVTEQFTVDILFDEPIVDFEKSDIEVSNGSISPLNGSGQSYQVSVIPQFPGEVKLFLPAGQVQDTAGNYNLASDTLVVYYSEPAQDLFLLSGQIQGRRVLLNWITNTDFKNQQFSLQRSPDSLSFTTIKIINSENRPAGPTQYQSEDSQPFVGKNFYRLVQQELDGQEKVSNTVVLTINFNAEEISLYPVPTSEKLYVNLSEYEGKEVNLMIYDIKGRMVGEQAYNALPPETIELDVSDYDDGLYFLQYSIKGLSRFSQKFTVFRTQD